MKKQQKNAKQNLNPNQNLMQEASEELIKKKLTENEETRKVNKTDDQLV